MDGNMTPPVKSKWRIATPGEGTRRIQGVDSDPRRGDQADPVVG